MTTKSIQLIDLSDPDSPKKEIIEIGGEKQPRVGVVSTVYRGGDSLISWCEHHYELGAAHVVLIFDRLDEHQEAQDAKRLRVLFPEELLTIWSGGNLMEQGWRGVGAFDELAELIPYAHTGASSYGIPARQCLNASAALAAAKTDELGGAPLDWMLHIDHDELFYLDSDDGGHTIPEHYMAAETAGMQLIRYVNHELMHPIQTGKPQRFKINPRVGQSRIGAQAWEAGIRKHQMTQQGPRPYFNGYLNGKSAVKVSVGKCAAGVHSWWVESSASSIGERYLAEPSILHYRFASVSAFQNKYLSMADTAPVEFKLFPPPRAEARAVSIIKSMAKAGAEKEEIHQALHDLHTQLTCFTSEEIAHLENLGAIFVPKLNKLMILGS